MKLSYLKHLLEVGPLITAIVVRHSCIVIKKAYVFILRLRSRGEAMSNSVVNTRCSGRLICDKQ